MPPASAALVIPEAKPEPKAEPKAPRGFGAKMLRGRVWWIRYSVDGVEHRESTKSEREIDAERLLKTRWKQIGAGRFVGHKAEKVTVGALLDALLVEYQSNGRRSTNSLTGRIEHLMASLGNRRACDVTGATVEAYKAERLTMKSRRGGLVAPATVNRELMTLVK